MENFINAKLTEIIFGVIIGLAIYLFKKIINDIEERVMRLELNYKDLQTEIYEFKDNYIERFQAINDKINESEKLLLKKINDVQIEIIKEISQLKNNLK